MVRVFKLSRNYLAGLKREARSTRPRVPRKKKAPRALTTMIKRIVRGQAETKYVADNFDRNMNQALPSVWTLNDLGAGALRFLPMIPRTQQGTDENERVGDQISPVGPCVTTLQFAYVPEDVSGHAVKVEVWYGTTKARKSWAQNPLSDTAFLDNGDGTNSAPGQNRETTMLPTDKRMVSFKKKTFILSKTTGSTGGMEGTGNFSANGGKLYRSIKLYCKPPKKLRYIKGDDEYPSNFAPGYFINYSFVNGDIPPTSVGLDGLINVTSRTHLHFKDM